MGRQRNKKIRIRSKRLSDIDESRLALAVWLMARQMIEERTDRPQPGPEAIGVTAVADEPLKRAA